MHIQQLFNSSFILFCILVMLKLKCTKRRIKCSVGEQKNIHAFKYIYVWGLTKVYYCYPFSVFLFLYIHLVVTRTFIPFTFLTFLCVENVMLVLFIFIRSLTEIPSEIPFHQRFKDFVFPFVVGSPICYQE